MSEVEVQEPVEQEDFAWRRERYEEMGFSLNEAQALAGSRWLAQAKNRHGKVNGWSIPLDWKKVETALTKGCTHAQALEIFVTDSSGL